MELNIVDINNASVPDAFGINPERQTEISEALNQMVRQFSVEKKMRTHAELCGAIAQIVNTPEELLYAYTLHIMFLERHGWRLNALRTGELQHIGNA